MPQTRADEFLRMIRRSRRGRLRVYLGYAAGVGKTCKMLEEGHALRKDGVDVVVGYAEPHGRPETERLVEGLELVPRRVQEYRGVALEEMDLDALLRRRPQVALVDELAHTNAPGSRNTKRFEDVEEILAEGIHVITTLNVQHLESLYGTVERAVSVRVRERLPDRILMEADQIVNVDVTPEDLQRRLREGRIYPMDRVETALRSFFTAPHLQRLRELTLREMAAQIDAHSRRPGEEEGAAAPDQVMVSLSSKGPNSEELLRYGSRLAGKLNRNWYAVYVQTPSEDPDVLDAGTQRALSSTLALAKQLGALVFTFKGNDVAAALLQFAKEYRAGHIVVGTPDPMPLTRRLLGEKGVVQKIVSGAGGATVVIVDTRCLPPPAQEPTRQPAPGRPILSDILRPSSVQLFEDPVPKGELLKALAHAACEGLGAEEPKVLEAVLLREAQGSTFLNEGAAFPHARLEGILASRAALGITRGGVLGSTAFAHLVFLILSPEGAPEEQLKYLAAASRIALDRNLVGRLLQARSGEEAFKTVRDWEQGA
jgi:two-component system, OmpR family, sensor histidine kinase KdpD